MTSKGKAPRKLVKIIPTPREIDRLIRFEEDEPFEILGPHFVKSESCLIIRAFLPRAEEAWIKMPGRPNPVRSMEKIHPNGLFRAVVEDESEIFPYVVGFRDQTGYTQETEDPYAFSPSITDYDLFLVGEGSHFKSYEKFGARSMTHKGVPGVQFAVWSPHAKSVSVVGNFNHWNPGVHPMSRVHFSGVWALFVPRLGEGEVYKFAIKSNVDGQIRVKTDPYAFQAELRPHTASVVSTLENYEWQDQHWIEKRRSSDPLRSPFSIYEVHLGSWARDEKKGWGFLNYRDLAHELVEYVKEVGYTHIELLPVMEHPLDESWGYQVVNYFAPTSRFGTPQDLMYFVDYCHQNGIGVLLDWVPAHFPKDGHGLNDFDGRQVYAYESWKKGEHKEWGTLVFDFGKKEVTNFLISNALFWLDKYHIDGLRVDAVASMLYLDYGRKPGEWEPNQFGGRENLEAVAFLKKFNEIVHGQYPGVVTIAEESTAWQGVSRPTYTGGLGFTMKWNMGWMHDTLEYFSKEPIYRKYHQGMLTFSLWYAFSENFVLPISHDEVVYGKRSLIEKMPGDDWQKFANLRLFLGYMYGHPGKKLLFMGSEFGQWKEWNVNQSLDWHLLQFRRHKQTRLYMRDLNGVYKSSRALYEGDFKSACFEWINFSDVDSSVLSFLRWSSDKKELLVFVLNMTPVPRTNYRFGVPWAGFYEEVLNSDAVEYGGSGWGNWGGIHSEDVSWNGRPYSLVVQMPPLAVNIFRWKA
ncbi:MAG TPA: 1,4-alpha-glucan branching protein GlgB [bacterium]|nr:1,4-alpha-glucan branching protein GlgB [bacterium]